MSNGYFSGGDDSLFSSSDDELYGTYRSFSLFPHAVSRTSDKALVHLAATLTLTGPRIINYVRRGRRRNYTTTGFVSFLLDGYYSSGSTSLHLCMVGAGTEQADDGSHKHYSDVTLRLHIPSPPSLDHPFVTGTLEGSFNFSTIHLLAYAEGDNYKYGSDSERAVCGTPSQQTRGSFQALGGSSAWCAHLKEQLVTSYRLQENGSATPTLLRRLREPRMHVNQMQCAADGAVRAYVVFSNDTRSERRGHYYRQGSFMVDEEAVVAEGRWDSHQGVPGGALALGSVCSRGARGRVRDRDEFLVPGRVDDAGAERRGRDDLELDARKDGQQRRHWADQRCDNSVEHRRYRPQPRDLRRPRQSHKQQLSDVKYIYNDTMLEEAKKHYNLRFKKEKIKGSHSFPGNYTYRDFEFQFYGHSMGSGQAYPVTVGSAMVYGDRLAAEDSFSQYAVVDPKQGLLRVGYDIHHSAPRVRPTITNGSYIHMLTPEDQQRISAEGVYDPEKGILCMVGCREHNGSTDCQILILHIKKNPEAARTTSITMLAILTLGYLTPLVLNFEALFPSRRSRYFAYSSGPLELKEVMMRAPILIAFVLQLRLLQLAWSGRRRSVDQMMPSPVVSERIVLQICLPLYLFGAVLAAIVHVINVRAAMEDSLVVRIGGQPATIWEDLVSYAGLILDGFLLPQVILNACLAGSGVRAVSPWFYIGTTMTRAMPHVYDVVRGQIYEQSISPSDLYASPRGDLFGVAWDIVIPCGAALLATLLFFQQRIGGPASLPSQRKRSVGYELVSNL
ncbi:unnamed protein product [Alopecurus aequalis]